MGFKPSPLRYRCSALTAWANKPAARGHHVDSLYTCGWWSNLSEVTCCLQCLHAVALSMQILTVITFGEDSPQVVLYHNQLEYSHYWFNWFIMEWCEVNSYPCRHQVGRSAGLPSEVIPDYENDEEFLKKVHHVLLEVSIQAIGDLHAQSLTWFPKHEATRSITTPLDGC